MAWLPHRWRVTATGAGVLVTSALTLSGSVAAGLVGDAPADGASAAKADPAAPQLVSWDVPDYLSVPEPLWAVVPVIPGPLGATGARPRNSKPSPALLRGAKLAASMGPGGLASRNGRNALAGLFGNPGALPPGPLGIPGIMLAAYQRAQQILAAQQPGCHLPWWLLAGIGQVESSQADGGLVDAQGNTLVPILGPVLDGTNGSAAIPMGGGWERAIGPMQFLPSTWSIWGGGGNPNNVYDAALAAGRYLCAGGRSLSDPAQQVAAVFSYNHSDSYVQLVLTWAYAYRGGVNPLPSRPLPASSGKLAAHHSPARPPRRPAPARGSSPSRKATKSPSGSPSPSRTSASPSPSPSATPTATPSPSPTAASPAPTPSTTSPSPSPSATSTSPASSSPPATSPTTATPSPSASG
jgi:hypothetical protein